MAFSATVVRILIASPSDVEDERESIHAFINEWNENNTLSEKVVLWPILWDAHPGQETIGKGKEQRDLLSVDDCDILIGIFWTRTDGHAGVVEPGAIENLVQFVESGKHALLYFSSRPVIPDSIDPNQYAQLRTFKERVKKKGNIYQYGTVDELIDMVNGHVIAKIRDINSDQQKGKVDKETESTASRPADITEDEKKKDMPAKKEQQSKPESEPLIDKLEDTKTPADSRRTPEESVSESTEIPIGDIDIESLDDEAQKAPHREYEKPIAGKKEDKVTDDELKKIKRKFMLELSRLEVEWIMERDSEPEEFKDSKSILDNVSKKLMDLQAAVMQKIDERGKETLARIIDDARDMQEHQILADGGKSYDAFWKKGNEIFQGYKKFIDTL